MTWLEPFFATEGQVAFFMAVRDPRIDVRNITSRPDNAPGASEVQISLRGNLPECLRYDVAGTSRAQGGRWCGRTVYRALRLDEDPMQGLTAKDSMASYAVEDHIINGGRPHFRSQYISTTTDLRVAQALATKTGTGVAEIDLTRVQGYIINLSTESGRQAHLKGATARAFARATLEVLIEGCVPPEAITVVARSIIGHRNASSYDAG